ncbi:hypothetical protein FB45DRAFT_1037623 [Roridomyces roridus]|uniref:Uncharacterized protein n=1 Tax=Roridomyces roridus TaxID=1738132 RepID=A0AAD7B693_9AGAR|nr:hypothetical protein FB45DRAFT_1037623 [Roridomyces roridus]
MAHHIFIPKAPMVPPAPCFIDELAQELIDRIIDFCQMADRKRIGSYGLVCKRWLPRSRYHLFATVYLDSFSLADYIRLVDGSTLPILSFTQHLHLFTGRAPLDEWLLHRLNPSTSLTSVSITVDVYRSSPGQGITDQLKYLDSLATHLRRLAVAPIQKLALDLAVTTEIPLSTLGGLVSCVPTVETLSITTNSAFLRTPAAGVLDLARLHELEIDAPNVRGWLNEGQDAPIKAFFARIGAKLEALELGITALAWEAVRAHYQDILAHCTALRRLTLKCDYPAQTLDLLPFLPSPEDAGEGLALTIVASAHGAQDHWARIDAALVDADVRISRFTVRSVFGAELSTKPTKARHFAFAAVTMSACGTCTVTALPLTIIHSLRRRWHRSSLYHGVQTSAPTLSPPGRLPRFSCPVSMPISTHRLSMLPMYYEGAGSTVAGECVTVGKGDVDGDGGGRFE